MTSECDIFIFIMHSVLLSTVWYMLCICELLILWTIWCLSVVQQQ